MHYFDLEDPEHLNRLTDAKLALEPLEGLIVIDEIQRSPELFPLLRVLTDRERPKQRYLIPVTTTSRGHDRHQRPAQVPACAIRARLGNETTSVNAIVPIAASPMNAYS